MSTLLCTDCSVAPAIGMLDFYSIENGTLTTSIPLCAKCCEFPLTALRPLSKPARLTMPMRAEA